MSWLTPLGFLGLIGLGILVIIYIIKPNFQQKIISSTYIWKLSLKYKKRRIPINKFRNILTFLCQVLIISLCAAILAGPIIKAAEEGKYKEKIAIIDASASMWTSLSGETRFERAVDEAKKLANEVAANDSLLTVIIAGEKASFVVQRAGAAMLSETQADLDELIQQGKIQCSYGEADIDGAIKLAENVLEENSKAEVLFITGKEYYDAGKIEIVDVSDVSEWNAGILDVRVSLEENYYKIAVDVACYGKDFNVPLYVDIYGANIEKTKIELESYVQCMNDQVQTIEYWANFEETEDPKSVFVYMYEYIHVHLGVADNYSFDDNYYVYGGVKPTINVQYYSTMPNNFYSGALMAWRNNARNLWDIDITEVKDVDKNKPLNPELSGFDVYIFEDKMPSTMPTDGIVLLVNPDKAPSGSGLNMINSWPVTYNQKTELEGDLSHEVMKNITNPENIQVMQHANLDESEGYTTLMTCNGQPVVMVKNEPMEKVAVIGFSSKWSTIAVNYEFPILISNIMNYFMPATIRDYAFDVNQTISINGRGTELTVSDPNGKTTNYQELPSELYLSAPGVYTITQVPLSGDEIVESFYVKSPASESNVTCKLDSLKNPYFAPPEEAPDYDPIFFFALALVAFLFIEWWLQSREHF